MHEHDLRTDPRIVNTSIPPKYTVVCIEPSCDLRLYPPCDSIVFEPKELPANPKPEELVKVYDRRLFSDD